MLCVCVAIWVRGTLCPWLVELALRVYRGERNLQASRHEEVHSAFSGS